MKLSYSKLIELFEQENIPDIIGYIDDFSMLANSLIKKGEFDKLDNCLYIQITDEIDHHTTEIIRRKMDNEITRFMPRKVVFDFSKVSFMDSAGIGLLIGRYKLTKMLGGITEIKNTSKSIEKVLEMSGITRIIPITQNGKVS